MIWLIVIDFDEWICGIYRYGGLGVLEIVNEWLFIFVWFF